MLVNPVVKTAGGTSLHVTARSLHDSARSIRLRVCTLLNTVLVVVVTQLPYPSPTLAPCDAHKHSFTQFTFFVDLYFGDVTARGASHAFFRLYIHYLW